MRRLPFDPAPLLVLAEGEDDQTTAEALGVSRRTVERWKSGDGMLGPVRADRLAIRIGSHPLLIWPEWETAG